MTKYNHVVCGGTFDHFHKGHKDFLKFTLSLGKRITIGLTQDNFIRQKEYQEEIEPYSARKKSIENFLKDKNKTVEIIPINDIFGPTVLNPQIDAIVGSKDTLRNITAINNKREKLNFPKLIIEIINPVFGEDKKIISSSRIRRGEINRNGRTYVNKMWLNNNLKLPNFLRKQLKKPFGVLFKNGTYNAKKQNLSKAIAIGDITTKYFNDNFSQAKISVVDLMVERRIKFSNLKDLGFLNNERLIRLDNPPGFITSSLFKSALDLLKSLKENKKSIVWINGEEDLAVLPFILAFPLGFKIFYGQPEEGIVEVFITEKIKEKVYSIVEKFTVS